MSSATAAGVAVAATTWALVSSVRPRAWGGTAKRLGVALGRWRAAIDAESAPDTVAAPRRTRTASAAAGAMLGWLVAGVVGVPAGIVCGPVAARRIAIARSRRRATEIDRGAGELAAALASALRAGRSVHGAIIEGSRTVSGAAGAELARTATEIVLGATAGDALDALRSRTGSRRIAAICGAIAMHERAGGDLAGLLQELSASFSKADVAAADARAATAQARYTAWIVALAPLAAMLLAIVARPGLVGEVFDSPVSVAMIAAAAALHLTGAVIVRGLAR